MIESERPTDDPIVELRCRDDILQAMYWMRGEGFGDEVDAESLGSLLVVDGALLRAQLAVLAADGLLEQDGSRYRLSAEGVREGGRRFADEFSDLQKTAHGECGPDCPICKGQPRDACAHCSPAALGW